MKDRSKEDEVADITINTVNKYYGDVHVIKDISLDIKSQSFTVLVGPSGCGKSTMLRMIAGLEDINSGQISIDGQVVNDLPPKQRNIAMVFQSYALYPHMNVYENMSFGLKMEKNDKSEIDQKVSNAAKMLQIKNLLKRKPKELSGGQRQRVAIGRAITRNPKIFLFDEPLSNLDAALRSEMRVEISKLHKKIGTNMIYVTHDQVEAMTLADRIVILNEGNIEQFSTPSEIYENPSNVFVAEFIGTPKMNIIKISKEQILNSSTINLHNNQIIFDGYDLEDDFFLGIRPEHIDISSEGKINYNINIDLIENLGFEKIIHASLGEHVIRIKTDKKSLEGINKISFSPENFYLFDKKGKRLRKSNKK